MMIFEKISRSWEYAKLSYSILWEHKHLMLFPLFSTVAAALVLASFWLPLWGSGTLDEWLAMMDSQAENATTSQQVAAAVVAFLFYFCNYFVIVFFNAGLVACALKVIEGERPTIGYGLSVATSRLGPIVQWALLSAVIGMILRAIENTSEKVGDIIAALLGSAWTALTYFVVPALVVEGVAPFKGVKRSLSILRETWGEALFGNFSLGLISFLVMLPVLLVLGFLGYAMASAGSMIGLSLVIVLGVLAIVALAASSSAADVILKALLYNYATGRTIPESLNTPALGAAFVQREKKSVFGG